MTKQKVIGILIGGEIVGAALVCAFIWMCPTQFCRYTMAALYLILFARRLRKYMFLREE